MRAWVDVDFAELREVLRGYYRSRGAPSNSPSFHSRLNVDTKVPHDARDIMAIA